LQQEVNTDNNRLADDLWNIKQLHKTKCSATAEVAEHYDNS